MKPRIYYFRTVDRIVFLASLIVIFVIGFHRVLQLGSPAMPEVYYRSVVFLLVFFLIFDHMARKIFCRLIVTDECLIYLVGGVLGGIFKNVKQFFFNNYLFHAVIRKGECSKLEIYNNNGKKVFTIKSNIRNMDMMVNELNKKNKRIQFIEE